MRKLQFIANCPHHYEGHELNECRITQEYVAALLFKQLGEYGFDAQHIAHEHQKVEVNIEKLNAHIADIVTKQNKLRTAIDEIVADLEGGTYE